jgi:hypothetical protein
VNTLQCGHFSLRGRFKGSLDMKCVYELLIPSKLSPLSHMEQQFLWEEQTS